MAEARDRRHGRHRTPDVAVLSGLHASLIEAMAEQGRILRDCALEIEFALDESDDLELSPEHVRRQHHLVQAHIDHLLRYVNRLVDVTEHA